MPTIISSTDFIMFFNIARPDWKGGISAFLFVSCLEHGKKPNQTKTKHQPKNQCTAKQRDKSGYTLTSPIANINEIKYFKFICMS